MSERTFIVRNISDRNYPKRTKEQVINLPGSLQRCLVARDVLVQESMLVTHADAYGLLVKNGLIQILNRGTEVAEITPELQAAPDTGLAAEAIPEFPLDSAARDVNPTLALPPEGETELPPEEFDVGVPESPAAAELEAVQDLVQEAKQEIKKRKGGNK